MTWISLTLFFGGPVGVIAGLLTYHQTGMPGLSLVTGWIAAAAVSTFLGAITMLLSDPDDFD